MSPKLKQIILASLTPYTLYIRLTLVIYLNPTITPQTDGNLGAIYRRPLTLW